MSGRGRDAAWLLALLVGYALLAGQAVTGALLGGLLAVGVVAAVEAAVAARHPALVAVLDRVLLGRALRAVARSALLALLVVEAPEVGPALDRAVLLALVALQAVRTVGAALADEVARSQARPVGWRHLPVPELEPAPAQRFAARWTAPLAARLPDLDLPLVVTGLLVAAGAPEQVLWVGLALVAAGLVGALAVLRRCVRAARTGPGPAEATAAVRAAVERTAPQLVVYFGGPPSSTHALNVWLPTLERLDGVQSLVVVRDRWHLDALATQTLPAVHLPRATDVEDFAVPSLRLALYPTNIVVNNHLLRVPGITDVFVGHGDSDKAGSSTPLSRIYDDIWVAGPAGRDRYRTAAVGVRDEQVREVGRPQLVDIQRARPRDEAGPHFTVLYAPTWEGFYAAGNYSSLAVMGADLVRALLALDGVRVLVKPHPASGSVDRAYTRAAQRVTALVREAGGPHAVVSGVTGLYEAFNASDLLVSDVSSVVTDFLQSGKPYAMTNPLGLPEQDYRTRFPSSGAAYLWSPDLAHVADDVADARGPDRLREERARLRAYLLGADPDPTAGFAAAVHAVLATSPARSHAVAD